MNVFAATSGALSRRSPIAHPLVWLLALAIAHVAVRVAVSPALKWDEAEQVLWSQQLRLGYGPQPPLYTWLQWMVNQVFGPSVLALAVLKHALLAAAFLFMWLTGRELLGPRGAWWASASMLLLPPLGWYSVRDQTHSVLVTALTCAAWWLLLRLARRPRPVDFAWLGLVCGLGMLAKYSFGLSAGALLVAALSVPPTRRALLSRGWWWAPLVGALVVLPHAVWLRGHLDAATAETLGKLHIQPEPQRLQGLLSLLEGLSATLLPWLLIALWAFRAAWWRSPIRPALPWAQRLFARYLALVLLALLGMVLLAGVGSFKGRWMLPLLCVAPLAAFAARPELQQHPRGGRYTAAIVIIGLLFLTAAGVRPWFSGLRGQVDELNHPGAELETALRQSGYDGQGVIVAADHMLAGMLRTRFPRAPVDSCRTGEKEDVAACVAGNVARARAAGRGWLLISREDRVEPRWWAQAQANIAPQDAHSIELPFHMVRDDVAPAHYRYVWHATSTTP
ncbi:ArnT family glycosyltransferase [Ottowia testudinis]|uniref:Glycosyltransferase family 39 protein n=1 Tax=Ottowia testudinis TaxID=2816950 RepID=A0A975CGT2_9BURK|nr:glycosyltransferase family 39 protein [Ottowia testudinis]QTD45294.1 glycosyltransferase family 39 protein [Ottowia testudinis]